MNDATTMPVFDRVADLVAAHLDADRAALTAETDLRDDLEADSLDRVDLMIDLEEAFRIEIPDEEVETCRTVGDLVRVVERRLQARDLVR